jgi:uncharacterized protein YjeT (DUF2065 family)
MNLQTIAAGFLRVVGLLLIVLGLVHWAAMPYIPPLLGESSSGVYQRAVGPTLLDHGLFGILLLLWARRVLLVNGVVVLTFPVSWRHLCAGLNTTPRPCFLLR